MYRQCRCEVRVGQYIPLLPCWARSLQGERQKSSHYPAVEIPRSHKRVLRIMRQESLLCPLKRQFVVTTDSAHSFPTYPNLLAERDVTTPDQAWVAAIPYVRLPTTFVYLAGVLDASSRRGVGWRLSRQMDTQLTLAALELALTQRCPVPGLIHHSDRGVQYASLS